MNRLLGISRTATRRVGARIATALAMAGLLGGIAAPSHAAVLVDSLVPAGSVVTDFSAPGLVSFDLDLASDSAVWLEFALEDGDLGGPLSFSSIVRNFTGSGIDRMLFEFDGASLATVGSVFRSFGGSATVNATAGYALVLLSSPEFLDVEIGNPLGRPGLVDWTLSTAGLSAGDRIRVSFSLSEPPALALAASLLLGLAALRLRQR